MEGSNISQRQLLVLLFTGLLALVVSLPAGVATRAGGLAWLAPVLALPVLLLLGWMLARLGDLSAALLRVLGKWLGGAVLICYFIWCLFLLGLHTRGAVGRLALAGYDKVPDSLLALVLLALVLWMAWGRLAAFCRAAELFYLALAVALGAILLLGVPHIDLQNLAPTMPVAGVASAVLPVSATGAVAVFGGFLLGRVGENTKSPRRLVLWIAAFCGVTALLLLLVVGRLGGLTAVLPAPFFTVTQGLGVEGAFQRVEALAASLWVLSDLALLGLLAFSGRAMATALMGKRAGRWAVPPLLLLALAATFLMTEEVAVSLRPISLAGNLIFGFLVPGLLLLLSRLKRE